MLIGNIAALRQTNVKRMLAYSSVGQAGYLLIAVVVHTPLATRAMLYYLAVYAAMNLGALAVVSVREREIGGPVSIDDLRGLGRDHPLLAGGLALSLLSLASFPPTGGFLAKLYLFGSAIDAGKTYLAMIGVIGTMISLAYYLRFLLAIYTAPRERRRPRVVPGTRLAAVAVLASAVIVLWLGHRAAAARRRGAHRRRVARRRTPDGALRAARLAGHPRLQPCLASHGSVTGPFSSTRPLVRAFSSTPGSRAIRPGPRASRWIAAMRSCSPTGTVTTPATSPRSRRSTRRRSRRSSSSPAGSAGQGVPEIVGFNKGGAIDIAGLHVTMTNAVHSSSAPDGTPLGDPAGFVHRGRRACRRST